MPWVSSEEFKLLKETIQNLQAHFETAQQETETTRDAVGAEQQSAGERRRDVEFDMKVMAVMSSNLQVLVQGVWGYKTGAWATGATTGAVARADRAVGEATQFGGFEAKGAARRYNTF